MNKRIEGTFADYEDLKETINNFLEQGFAAKQLLVLTRNEEGQRLEKETDVEVVITSEQEESLWDKIVSFFTVDLSDDDDDDEDEVDEEDIFEDYGIDEDTYERFEEALENGEYLLLIDDAPPAQPEPSDYLVRDGIIPKEEDSMNNDFTDKTPKSAKPDWVNTDDNFNGDVEQHSAEAVKSASAHPDPEPGVTEADGVEQEIPKSQHPDPIVDDEGNEIPVDPDMMEVVDDNEPTKGDAMAAEHQAAHPDPEPGETESDDVVTEIPQSAHPDPVVYDTDDETTDATDAAPTDAAENPDLEEDTTGEPVEAPDPHGDPTMADQNQALDPMQFDEVESHPETEDDESRVSRDPFGGDTEEGADDEDVEPEYDESDRKPPAL